MKLILKYKAAVPIYISVKYIAIWLGESNSIQLNIYVWWNFLFNSLFI